MVNFGSALSPETLDERIIALENNSTPKAQCEKDLLLIEKGRRENLPKIKKTKYPCTDCKKSPSSCVDCNQFKKWRRLSYKHRDYTE